MSVQNNTKTLTFSALMVVVMILCSWISIPLSVPFTLQTFGVFFALRLLGGKRGTSVIAVYILMGTIGLPVFSGFGGGIGHLLGPTGGYILGFLGTGICYALLECIPGRGRYARLWKMTVSLVVCYLFGTLWFIRVYGEAHTVSAGTALMSCVIPFVLPDLIKISAADILAGKMERYIPDSLFTKHKRSEKTRGKNAPKQ